MVHIFDQWGSLNKRLTRSRHIFLCLDFDGTLSAIKPTPRQAVLTPAARRLLKRLSACRGVSLGVISGRGLEDLKRKVGIKQIIFAANHGLEIEYHNKYFVCPGAKRFVKILARAAKQLNRKSRYFAGAVLEAKGLSLSLHYRRVPKQKLVVLRKIFFSTIKPYQDRAQIKLTFGKKVWEARAAIDWDKGRALLWLMQRLKPKVDLAVFIGDDLTDEDGFRAVNKIGGISVRVMPKKGSSAKYYLKGTAEVKKFLKILRQIRAG